MLPSHSEIIYFLEIAKTGNFSRAAERLGITQPTLTLAMKKLEGVIGRDLFIRSKKGVELTYAGKKFRTEANQFLDTWENLKRKTIESEETVTGNFSIGCHPSVGLYTLKYFMPSLLRKYPDLDIKLIHDLSRLITDQVIGHQIDLALVINPVQHPDLIINDIAKDEVKIWQSTSKDTNMNTLICDPSLIQSQTILRKFKAKKLNITKYIHTSSLENASKLCEAGAGLAIIPQRVVTELALKKVRPLENGPIFNDVLSLIYRVENKNVEAIKRIKGEILSAL